MNGVVEHLMNVLAVFGTRFVEEHAVLFCHLFALFSADLPFAFQVGFVSNKNEQHGFRRLVLAVLDPGLNVLEAVSPRDVVHDQSARTVLVVRSGDRAEVFLTRRVPYLHSVYLIFERKVLRAELNADRRLVVVVEVVMCVAEEQVGLAHRGVADYYVLEQEIEIDGGRRVCHLRCYMFN